MKLLISLEHFGAAQGALKKLSSAISPLKDPRLIPAI
jgi:hypothetical protein